MSLQVINGIIAAGESLSEGVDCTAGEIVRLTMPPEWTKAPLSFQISSDGNGYNNLVDLDGEDVTIDHVVPGSAVVLADLDMRAVAFLKVRSGTSRKPVPQEAHRDFAVAVDVPASP